MCERMYEAESNLKLRVDGALSEFRTSRENIITQTKKFGFTVLLALITYEGRATSKHQPKSAHNLLHIEY